MATEFHCLSPTEIEKRLRSDYNITIEENKNDSSSTNSFANSISYFCSSKYLIPVICEDMYEYEYEDQQTHIIKRQSLRSYMIHKVFSKINTSGISLSAKELNEIASGSYYGVQLLEEKLKGPIFQELFKSVIDIENNKIREGISIKKEVEEFLQLGNFPLIITTNCFPILEEIVLPQYHYTSAWYSLQTKKTSKEKDAPKTTIKKLPNKCVYHIFGEAQFGRAEWGYNDKQVLKYLKNACSDDYAMSELSTYVADNKTLLFLGNDTPDWLFRFILTPLYGRDVYETGTDYYITEKGSYDEERLSHFLKDIHFEKESNLIDVLTNVNNSLRYQKESTPSTYGHKKQYDFFVSYASEDKEIAFQIIEILNNHGITNIWYDKKQIIDDDYWDSIIEGICQSAFFLPIVTEQYMDKVLGSKSKLGKALSKANLTKLSLNAKEARDLNNYAPGVQVELLLVSEYLANNPQKPYSIPIVITGQFFYGNKIDKERVDNWGRDSSVLPENLFYGKNAIVFDPQNPSSFVMDWDRYKSENELNNE